MNILDLPAHVETKYFTAWRNTWAHRKLNYPYVGYYIKTEHGTVELWARPNTDLKPFFEKLRELEVETAESLAYWVYRSGTKGLFRGSHWLKAGEMHIALDPLEDERLSFVFYLKGKELMLTAPPHVSLVWLIAVLESLAKNEKEREENG